MCPNAVPNSSHATRFSDVVRPLLDTPLKEMLVLHSLDLYEMSHELPAEGEHTATNRENCKRFRINATKQEEDCNS